MENLTEIYVNVDNFMQNHEKSWQKLLLTNGESTSA
jgi:hypothetical protein